MIRRGEQPRLAFEARAAAASAVSASGTILIATSRPT
jgi:hypothetical protein